MLSSDLLPFFVISLGEEPSALWFPYLEKFSFVSSVQESCQEVNKIMETKQEHKQGW